MDIDRLIRRDMEESLQKYEAEYNCLKKKYDKLKEDYADLNCHYAAALDKLENPWVSVEDRLPEIPKPDEGYCCFLVSDGSLIHMAYYTEDGWLFSDCGEMKEMFYEVTHWCGLPDYPNLLKREGVMQNE